MELTAFQELIEFMIFFILRFMLPLTLFSFVIYISLYKLFWKPFYHKQVIEKELDKKILMKCYKRNRIGKKRRESFANLCIVFSYMLVLMVIAPFWSYSKDVVTYLSGNAIYEEVTIEKVWTTSTGRSNSTPYVRVSQQDEKMYYEGIFLLLEEGKNYEVKYLPTARVILNYKEKPVVPNEG